MYISYAAQRNGGNRRYRARDRLSSLGITAKYGITMQKMILPKVERKGS